jgi:hypothetical protein
MMTPNTTTPRSTAWHRVFDIIEEAAEVAERLGLNNEGPVSAPQEPEVDKRNPEESTDAR